MTTEPAYSAEDRRRPLAVVAAAVAAFLLAAGALGGYVLAGDVPRGTRLLGVDIGGTSRVEAERRLLDHLAGHGRDPVRIRLDGRYLELAPAAFGLRVDVGRSVGRAIRGGIRPAWGRDVAPVVRLDRDRLETALRGRLDSGRITMRRPAITFDGLTPQPSYPVPGLDLDPAAAARAVRAAWPVGAVADVPLVRRAPVTTRAQVDALVAGLARPAVAASVTVRVGAREVRLRPAAIAAGLVFRADHAGRLSPGVDGTRLHAAAALEFARVEDGPWADATVLAGRPRIVASRAGEVVDLDRLGRDLLAVLGEPAPRTVSGVLRPAAAVTDADLAALGIRMRVATFTTYFTGGRSSSRSHNIITIADAVDGAIVRPGETFSVNAHTGERGYAAGYRDAPVIIGGRLEPGVGGGASQFATTLFNAAYYAGLEDVEHKPHSFYFPRYPAVIESTIFFPTLDLKFRNTTPYGILIDTATTGRSVTVSLWSTRVYDSVTTEYGPRRRPTAPPVVRRPAGPRCITSSGLPGFTQAAWRVIRKDGREVERKRFTWRYDPEPRFVCGKTP